MEETSDLCLAAFDKTVLEPSDQGRKNLKTWLKDRLSELMSQNQHACSQFADSMLVDLLS